LAEEVSFLNKANIKETLLKLPKKSIVTIDASNSTFIDFDVLEIINDFVRVQAPENKIEANLVGFKHDYKVQNSN
jgi:MFS superfamily sulfate permease-like transporter